MMRANRIDFHTHTFLSDGELLPSELLRRAAVLGHKALAITDHADATNLSFLIESLLPLLNQPGYGLELVVGVELTHVPPENIARLARRAKQLGAEIVVVHGETIVEPVAAGTNLAAVESVDVDVLAHPGMLTADEARLAAERGCYIEITSRKGHSLTNGHVARRCLESGAPMLLNTDTHSPSDLISMELARRIAAGAGLDEAAVSQTTLTNPKALLERVLERRRRYSWA